MSLLYVEIIDRKAELDMVDDAIVNKQFVFYCNSFKKYFIKVKLEKFYS